MGTELILSPFFFSFVIHRIMHDQHHRQSADRLSRRRIQIEGVVQGVGFRPFVYQSAVRFGLTGWVCNDTGGVTIEVEGETEQLAQFLLELQAGKPPLAVINQFDTEDIPVVGEVGFQIRQSRSAQTVRVQVAPDTFVCTDCQQELFDPHDRRFRYPFINCTNCGPRFTIVTGIPYDRHLTTMADFPLCPACQAEYGDPSSRRFHAQPNACPDCGPQLALIDAKGGSLPAKDPLLAACEALHTGRIIAIKGLGGYHLAVDAANDDAVRELRRRKQRDEKPFALMASDLATVRRFALCNEMEAKLLTGPERPIVLLEKRNDHGLAETVAPDNRYFGMMLPYTPLHHLLFAEGFTALVMTSANRSDEPIAFEDSEAVQRLSGIADLFLVHNRRIETRTDDSIARVMAGKPLLLRRSRGYVPRMVKLPRSQSPVLAVGAELKSTICFTRGDQAYLSQHIGDLKNLEVYGSFTRAIEHLQEILEVTPQRVACDLHPDYYSSHFAVEESGLPAIPVQHHHAHLASCLAEHGRQDPAIGVIFDGIGYGTDGHIWGGEFLVGDLSGFERAGHFRYQQMPGGDLATRQPWRMALSYLLSAFGEIPGGSPALAGLPESDLRLVTQALDRRVNTPLTSSCGRLFDAVAALLGLRQQVTFEGQAAMALEMSADSDQDMPYPYQLCIDNGRILFDPLSLIRSIVDGQQANEPVTRAAGRFHLTLAMMVEEVCSELRSRTGNTTVVLSGGVFQNCLLTELTRAHLEKSAFTVLTHALVPPNDGGLALGQAVIAGQSTTIG
jgi:hydrogenase maturation protein HypF